MAATAFEMWAGHDTFGRPVEVARRNGESVWYARHQQRTAFGVGMSKWAPHTPVWLDRVPASEMNPDQTPVAVPPFITWGFQRLSPVTNARLRLPK